MAETTTTAEVVKQIVETTTLPAGITVSGLTFLGVSFSEWVFIGTAFLLICNLFLTLPKVYRVIKSLICRTPKA